MVEKLIKDYTVTEHVMRQGRYTRRPICIHKVVMSGALQTHATHCAASGEVGLLNEEAAQRLLLIFAETAFACLKQIYDMAKAHGAINHKKLFSVGLSLVNTWESDVIQEETVQMETKYPEVASLHSYVFLWLLDKLCTDKELNSLSVPPLPDVYCCFMRRMAIHPDVKRGEFFLTANELTKRSVYVEAFRGAYHDIVQRKMRSTGYVNTLQGLVLTRQVEATVSPSEAASQVGDNNEYIKEKASSAISNRSKAENSQKGSALQNAMEKTNPTHPMTPADVFVLQEDVKNNVTPVSDVVPPSTHKSQMTRAITVTAPCFFSQDQIDAAAFNG